MKPYIKTMVIQTEHLNYRKIDQNGEWLRDSKYLGREQLEICFSDTAERWQYLVGVRCHFKRFIPGWWQMGWEQLYYFESY